MRLSFNRFRPSNSAGCLFVEARTNGFDWFIGGTTAPCWLWFGVSELELFKVMELKLEYYDRGRRCV